MVGVRKADRGAAGIDLGDRFEVAVALDNGPRSVEVPLELGEALAGRPDLAAVFDGLSFRHVRAVGRRGQAADTRARAGGGTLDRLAGRGDDDQRSRGAKAPMVTDVAGQGVDGVRRGGGGQPRRP